ncbi:hypothetical protein J2046_006571 [Rhizobium petrolearium]|uniref:Uncharacterized protein n=2 Tax=Neorhizobium TaxID=1525371 RepID=A0ABV0MC31_9HYPH|nr:hypothetical protein [Neorhizobium petrolearium]MBP1848280.1 hypothetical protein [Neorhizobium petrolearium]MCC2614435.1 hypothetical protein [Neorhizobium petrolearium]WGI72532.1 hypothetical protein QEO92_32080 [Neorhizobium petrolearium]
MRDDRRLIVNQETDHKANDGFATFGALVFGGVMTIALIDYGLTAAWRWSVSMWDGILSFFTF